MPPPLLVTPTPQARTVYSAPSAQCVGPDDSPELTPSRQGRLGSDPASARRGPVAATEYWQPLPACAVDRAALASATARLPQRRPLSLPPPTASSSGSPVRAPPPQC